jgi:hypothetical protein
MQHHLWFTPAEILRQTGKAGKMHGNNCSGKCFVASIAKEADVGA